MDGETYSTTMGPQLVVALVEAAVCQQRSFDAHRAKVRVAAEYAAYCRETDVALSVVTGKFALLREAFWRVLRGSAELDERRRLRAVVWIDVAFSLLIRASMLGSYKAELEERRLWSALADDLAFESPRLAVEEPGAGWRRAGAPTRGPAQAGASIMVSWRPSKATARVSTLARSSSASATWSSSSRPSSGRRISRPR